MATFSFKEVAPCLFAIFIDIMGFGLVAPLLVALFTTPEHNIFQISSPTLQYLTLGVTLALYPLLMFFGTAFIGDLSDIIGRKKTLLISMFGMAIGFYLMGEAIVLASLPLFLFGRALSGLVSASQSVALATISDLSTPDNKAIHLSYVALIQCMGFVVGPLMGGLLSDLSMQMPFIGSAIAAMIAFVWILAGFEETFVKTVKKKIDFSRLVTVFAEAYHNRQIRMLSIIFLLMQLGVSFYLPITLIILTTQFNYTPFQLGLFNGYLGIGFALGLILFLPKMLKRYRIEKIVAICLLLTFFSLLLSSVLLHEWALWVFALPCSITLQTAFSGMFTSYSNAADETSQGWVMGISVAVMAIAWAIGGFCTQLSLTIGPHTLIFIGAILLAVSTIGMRLYCKIYTEQQPS